jgi:uncharacterized membrane protein
MNKKAPESVAADTGIDKKITLKKFLSWVLLIGGIIGTICAFVIMLEKIELMQNPTYSPPCDLNPVISCGSVMASSQAHAFGFPNPLIGLVAFPVLITLGVIGLTGVAIKRWMWWGVLAGTVFGLGFVHWLFYQSVYHINALCPYCMAVWAVTITTFWYTLLYNLQLSFDKLSPVGKRVATFMRRHHLDILVFWFVIIAALILKHFWYYFGSSF